MPASVHRPRPLLLLLLALLLRPSLPSAAAPLSEPGYQPGELARVQMHRNSLRGAEYLSTRRGTGGAEPARFTLRPISNFALDGDPELNVRGGVYALDGAGDLQFGFLHFNGYRLMRAYTGDGRKLWQVDNPSGRVHRDRSHRDTLAVFNADGKPGQEIVHCWSEPGVPNKLLVLRDGETGQVLKQVQIAGQDASEECQIAAFQVEGGEPVILIAGKAPEDACPQGNFTPYFAKTYAYTTALTKLWERTTCAAGHFAWPLDENGDGLAEAIFVGKYLLRPDGITRCVLPIGVDHVDSMVVADLDPSHGGYEALVVGSTGTHMFDAGSCTLRWSIGPKTIPNPQQTGAAYLSAGAAAPSLLVTSKLNAVEGGIAEFPLRAFVLDALGRIIGSYTEDVARFATPMQNANLDGAPAAEDRLTTFGQVVDGQGNRRLDTSWYWGLQTLTAAEQSLFPSDMWTMSPFAFDLNSDGRDELVVWGRRRLVVGTLAGP